MLPARVEETEMTITSVLPADVRAMLHDGAEIALIDVREEGVFAEEGHPFFANSVPLSRLELMIGELVPRKTARVVILDGGEEGLAERAAATLAQMGYRTLAIMAGGAPAPAAAGVQVFTRGDVASKGVRGLVEPPRKNPPHTPHQPERRPG